VKKVGVGSIAIILFAIAAFWSFSIRSLGNFCLGDTVLNTLGLKAWSNGNPRTHYTIFYAALFLIPAIFIASKYPNHLLAKTGKILSIVFVCLILVIMFFMI